MSTSPSPRNVSAATGSDSMRGNLLWIQLNGLRIHRREGLFSLYDDDSGKVIFAARYGRSHSGNVLVRAWRGEAKAHILIRVDFGRVPTCEPVLTRNPISQGGGE